MLKNLSYDFLMILIPIALAIASFSVVRWDHSAILASITWGFAAFVAVTRSYLPILWFERPSLADGTYGAAVIVGSLFAVNTLVFLAGYPHPFFFTP